jgi:DNA-directed RNA polymerase subunit RPC12/RpoP
MPKCPNCGRETYRTEDWACQWCGHPLLSSAFKPVPKTYRQIQEERAYGVKSALEEEPEPEPGAEGEPAPLPATEPEPEMPPAPEPEPPQMLEPEPEIEPEAPAPPEPAELKSEAAPPPEPEAETIVESEPAAPPEALEAEEEAEPVSAPEPEAEPVAETEPEVEKELAPAPVAVPALEPDSATGTIDVTVEELNAALNSDKAGASSKLMDKMLKVTGTVDKIFARDNLDIFYIILAGAGGPSAKQVRCTFSREHSAYLSRLTEGQTATVKGIYAGYERNIILKECGLIQ